MINITPEQADSLGKANYDAYCELRNWKSFKGDALPQWENSLEEIKLGWRIGALAVLGQYNMFSQRVIDPPSNPTPMDTQ